MITQNLKQTQNNIAEAAKKSGRTSDDILLVAVSKTKPLSALQEAYNAGIRDFGENKVQELCDKYDQLPKDIRWHMIGHLQRNKVKYLIGKVTMIHSVDSLRLAEEISKESVKKDAQTDILLEINCAGEEQIWHPPEGYPRAGAADRSSSKCPYPGADDGCTAYADAGREPGLFSADEEIIC